MDRRDKILEQCGGDLKALVDKNIREAEEYFNQNRELIEKDFFQAMGSLFENARNTQLKNNKGKINFFCLNSLYSSIITETYEFQFSLKNKDLYLDNIETETYWTPSFVFKNINNDMDIVEKIIKYKFDRITAFEISEIKYAYALLHSTSALKFIFELVSKIKEQDFFDTVDTEESFDITFSLHMEKVYPLKL